MVALAKVPPKADRSRRKARSRAQFSINGPAYVKVHGRVYKLMPNALRSYFHEYGLDGDSTYGYNDCLEHIAREMEVALARKAKPVGIRGRLFQYESPSLLFKLVGSKVMNIRISLKTGEFEAEEDDYADEEFAEEEQFLVGAHE